MQTSFVRNFKTVLIFQEYARSGKFERIILIDNPKLDETIGGAPVIGYYDELNKMIASTIHMINVFDHSEPEIGQVSRPADINRIRSVGALNIQTLDEKWFFNLDTERDLCYYLCINEERLAEEGMLHRKLVKLLKDKPTNAFRKISYAIYGTPHNDFGYVVAHTNTVQQQNTLDKIDQG